MVGVLELVLQPTASIEVSDEDVSLIQYRLLQLLDTSSSHTTLTAVARDLFSAFLTRISSEKQFACDWIGPTRSCVLGAVAYIAIRRSDSIDKAISIHDAAAVFDVSETQLSLAVHHVLALTGFHSVYDDPRRFLPRALKALGAPQHADFYACLLLRVCQRAWLAYGFSDAVMASALALVTCRGIEGLPVNDTRVTSMLNSLNIIACSRGSVDAAIQCIFTSLTRLLRWLPFGQDFAPHNVDSYLPELLRMLEDVIDIDEGEVCGLIGCDGEFIDVEKRRRSTRLQRLCIVSRRLATTANIFIDVGALGVPREVAESIDETCFARQNPCLVESLFRKGVPAMCIANGGYNIDMCPSLIDFGEKRRRDTSRK